MRITMPSKGLDEIAYPFPNFNGWIVAFEFYIPFIIHIRDLYVFR